MPPDLFAPDKRPPVAPTGRSEPRLWVRRVVILSDPKTIIRDVLLKPGLNIVWTPDMSSSGNRALAHGSGARPGCEICKPAIASILASLWNGALLSPEHETRQYSNARFLANIQRRGT